MKYYKYCEPWGDKIITEDEILDEYWDEWTFKMTFSGQDERLITPENCIQDFITINWAFEIERPI